ncbi:hypothetical protein D0C36_05400 [Mucilaginibacter conchicola]|uniref:Uncharacterized protein n=1 Tax=Mucilaginibacter conchicola TaxID=2303333 RepID=A0A372NYI7_9SPHI|nr:hypothetical protein [Mucilaginibacter conchicola]RFZ94964.1 hypothetical protein D0C36_05400 [Mucilaginibacter conchicola]
MEQEPIPFPPPKKGGPENSGMKIVGINFAVFIGYTIILSATLDKGDWAFASLIFAGAHAFICLIVAAVVQKWAWALAGLLLVIAGFSTCVLGVFSS